jgi:hypothetical protein
LAAVALVFFCLSAAGLVASIIVHVASLFGVLFADLESYLFAGVFVVWAATIFFANKLSADFPRKDYWKAALRGAPKWVGVAMYVAFGYALLNFLLLIANGSIAANQVRALSGHTIAFYAAAAGVLYSAWRLPKSEPDRRCVQGHLVSPSAQFCERCGSPVIDRQVPGAS